MIRGYSAIGLHLPKTAKNVGSTLRAADCYSSSMVAIAGKRYKESCTDTTKAYRRIPTIECDDLRNLIPLDCVPVAVDLIEGATPLHEYKHPERAFYIFGPEDGTLGELVTGWCRDIIYVPTNGCMNLAASVNVVLYDRMCKQLQKSKQVSEAVA